tara:strand:- start:27203 stop:27799 length:597 start_codon:yes stop_codon:yes gene_type:complete
MPQHYKSELKLAGCDEAGRGCLAGPVVAAAVILPKNFKNRMLNDSKVISAKNREILRIVIEKEAISFGIGIVDSKKIDEINILNASFLAMHKAIDTLNTKIELLLIDGNRFHRYKKIPHKCIIKGDGRYLSIAAASILAKTYRDDIMKNIDLKFPQYKWRKNKGYPTREHRQAISKYGPTRHHRESFKLLPNQLTLNI